MARFGMVVSGVADEIIDYFFKHGLTSFFIGETVRTMPYLAIPRHVNCQVEPHAVKAGLVRHGVVSQGMAQCGKA